MHILHFPFFFFTTTEFASQSRYLTSRVEPIFSKRSTSSLTAFALFGPSLCLFCFTGLYVGSTLSSCDITSMMIPFMSDDCHAKESMFSLRNANSSFRIELRADGDASFGMFVVYTDFRIIISWMAFGFLWRLLSIGWHQENYVVSPAKTVRGIFLLVKLECVNPILLNAS